MICATGCGIAAAAPAPATASPATSRPFVLEHGLHARRTVGGDSITLDDVVTGHSVLVSGDRLQLSIRTSQRGYLYVAFCSQHDTGARVHGFSVFPAKGSIELTPDVERIVPSIKEEIKLDDHPGRETIFIVVSKTELSRSDSRLANILHGARQGADAADCDSLQRVAAGPAKPAAKPAPRPANRGVSLLHDPPSHRPPPVATIERGVDIVLNPDLAGSDRGEDADSAAPPARPVDAGPDGIVVLRYDFRHVAPGAAAAPAN
jgi:hypothetical protein